MNIVIVGKKNGKRHIQWLIFFLLGTVLGVIGGLVSGCIYYLLCGRWSHTSVIYGIAAMIGMILVGLIAGLRTPLDKLQALS
jgi:predicted membrane-bound spermidine synthase